MLVRRLLEEGRAVRVVVPEGEDTRSIDGLDVERVTADVRDAAAMARAFAGADLAFHLAAIITPSPRRRDLMRSVNVDGTRNVIRACLQCGVRRLLYVSTVHALAVGDGPVDGRLGFSVDAAVGDYGRTKAQAALDVQDAVAHGLDAVIACPAGVVGPHDYRPSDFGQTLLDAMQRRVPMVLQGGFDFVDVRDVADGLLRAATRGKSGGVYVLSGEWLSIREVCAKAAAMAGVRAPRIALPTGLATPTAFAADAWGRLVGRTPRLSRFTVRTLTRKVRFSSVVAREELAWSARPVRESLADAVRWLARDRGIELPAS